MRRTPNIARGALPAWKFEAPALPEELLPREHLITKMEEAIGRARSTGDVFLMSAPAGYGKTTLLAQWAAQTTVRVVWYHLDASDNDAAVLLSGIVRALRGSRLARAEWQVEALLRRVQGGAISTRDLLRASTLLIKDLREQVTRPVALVLTGIAALTANGDGLAVLDRLLQRPPDHVRLVIETVEAPGGLRFSPLTMQRRLHGLSAEDLALRETEVTDLLRLIGATLDEQQEAALRTLCEGWMTGILLATGAQTPAFLQTYDQDELDRSAIFDYLSSRVIDALPRALRGFAEEVAILERMTPLLCAQLLDLPDEREARARLAALERRTGFVTRSGRRPGEPIYRFQPLLRQALLLRLESRADGPERRAELHERAGMLLEEHGDDEEAVQQYAQAQAYANIVTLIEARRGSLLRAGRGTTLARWLALLPEDVRCAHPHLQILLAEMHRLAGRMAEARAVAERACAICLPLAATQPGLAARAVVGRGQILFIQGHYQAAREDIKLALLLAPPDDDEVYIAATFVRVAGLAITGDTDEACACLDDLEPHAARLRDLWALSRLYYLRSKILLDKGNYAEAEATARRALQVAQEANNEVDAVNSHLNLGDIALRTGNLLGARDELMLARDLAEETGFRQGEAYAVVHLGELELCQGKVAAAQATFARATALAQGVEDAYAEASAHVGRSIALCAQGETEQAAALLREALAAKMPQAVERGLYCFASGVVALHQSALAEADDALTQASAVFAEHELPFEQARAGFYRAEALLLRQDQAAGEAALLAALDAAARACALPPLAVDVRRLPQVQRALAESAHPLAAPLLAEVHTPPARATTATVALASDAGAVGMAGVTGTGMAGMADGAGGAATEPEERVIRAFALGAPRVLLGSEQARWRLPAARELLFYLLEQGKPVRKAAILAALWPEKSETAANAALRAARFHLKKALGESVVTQEGECLLVAVPCHLDVGEFERAADEGLRLAGEGEISAAASALRRALSYWNGPYLPDVDNDWATLRREQLTERYLSCAERLAELEMRLSHLDKAAQLYYRILDEEPHRESAYRGLMQYFILRDEPTEALKQFQRCVNVLQEMNMPPSPKTLTLYRNLMKRVEESARAVVES